MYADSRGLCFTEPGLFGRDNVVARRQIKDVIYPSALVFTDCVSPVLTFFTVTVASGTLAPDESVTIPRIVPRSWESPKLASNKRIARNLLRMDIARSFSSWPVL
jgi:hypothetical protein